MAYCEARGLRLYYMEAGEGDPVVLLHPAPLDHTVWMYQVLSLAARFRVIAMDQRCFGRSAKPETPFALDEYGEDLVAFLDAMAIPSAHIVGLSLGGIAAQMAALRYPSRVRRMVLVGTTAITTTAPFIRDRLARFRTEEFISCYRDVAESLFSAKFLATEFGRYFVDRFTERARTLSRESMLRFYEALQHLDLIADLKGISSPTLVLAGTEDVTFDLSRLVARGIPGAEFAALDGFGRAIPVEAPVQFTRMALEFLTH